MSCQKYGTILTNFINSLDIFYTALTVLLHSLLIYLSLAPHYCLQSSFCYYIKGKKTFKKSGSSRLNTKKKPKVVRKVEIPSFLFFGLVSIWALDTFDIHLVLGMIYKKKLSI